MAGGRGVGEEHRGPGGLQGAWRWWSSPCGSSSVPVQGDDHRQLAAVVGRPGHRGGDRRGQLVGRIAGGRRARGRRRAAARRRSGSALSVASRSRRRVGSIIGWARPWVRPSSPKSMTTWGRCAGRRRGPAPATAGCWTGSGRGPRRRRASPRRERAAAEQAPQRAGHRAARATSPASSASCGAGAPSADSAASVAAVRSGRPCPSSGPVDRRAQRRGVRLHLRQHLGCRRLGHHDDRGRWPGRRPGRASACRVERPPTAADRSRPPTPRQWLHPDARGVEQAHDLLGAGAGGGHDPDRAGADDVGEAEPDPADDRGAAVGAHHAARRAAAAASLRRDLVARRGRCR